MIQDICNKNYVKFCDSMDNVITMRRDVKDLNVGWSYLIHRALKDAERYMSLQKTQQHVEKAYEDLIILDNLVVLAERVTTLVVARICILSSRTRANTIWL